MKVVLITLAAIVGIGLVGLCMVMSNKNKAISLEENVNAAKFVIDMQLSNRFNNLFNEKYLRLINRGII